MLIRHPFAGDGHQIWSLIRRCKPLDLNSKYAYMLLGSYFPETCAVADEDGAIVGFASGFIPPGKPDTLFIWQIAVHPDHRGRGLARKLLDAILERTAGKGVRFLETTVGPSNSASRRLFVGLSKRLGVPLAESVLFRRSDFGDDTHEEEILYRIGGINDSNNDI